jgi:hypothetical protein
MTGVLLWAVQGLLAAIFLFAGSMKLLMPIELMTEQSPLPGWFLQFIGVAEVLGALAALSPRPFVVAGGQLWTASTRATALELGADHVEQDPRALVAELHQRIPPPG